MKPGRYARNKEEILEQGGSQETLDAIKLSKPRKKRKLPKVISRVEATALLEAAGEDTEVPNTVALRNRLCLELMYRAGLRVSEVIHLKPRDIELDGVIHLYDAKGGDGTAYFQADDIGPQLQAWLAIRETWISADGVWPGADTFPLFVRIDGQPMTVRYLQRLVRRLKAVVGIRGIVTPHVFRHSFATELLEEGFSLVEVQSALRHAHLATTAIYLHVRDESLRRKMSRRGQPRLET